MGIAVAHLRGGDRRMLAKLGAQRGVGAAQRRPGRARFTHDHQTKEVPRMDPIERPRTEHDGEGRYVAVEGAGGWLVEDTERDEKRWAAVFDSLRNGSG
jgi:hypothetical protein